MFDPQRATLRDKIATGRCLGVTWLSLGSAAIAEIAGRSMPDAIVIDLQHGLWERRELEAAIGLVPPEVAVLVRTAENTAQAIGMALDAGAEGVIVPLVETEKQARKAVSYARFPPHGQRSGGGVRPLADFVRYVAGAEKIVVLVMIETHNGVMNAAEIAAIQGVDMVFIGTGDLALSIGAFPDMNEDHSAACAEVHRACQSVGTPCGVFTPSLEMAEMRREQGYRLVVTSNDVDLLAGGFTKAGTAFAATQDRKVESRPPAPAPQVER